MKVAVIDLGTNTFHLLIAEIGTSAPFILYKTTVPVRLGEQITINNSIIPAAFERGLICLKQFKSTISTYGAESIKAIATSGIRSAVNGLDFVNQVKNETSIIIEIIDGNEEAGYIYEGVKWSGAIIAPGLIMDIGGGSTEFMLCTPDQLLWKKSYDIGAARLLQHFFKSDPLTAIQKQAIRQHLDEQLKDLIDIGKANQPQLLIGSAGAFETFYEMTAGGLVSETAPINYTAYKKLSYTLTNSTHQERENMPGLISLRVDMIVMAAILTDYVLEKLDIHALRFSAYDLKMGALKRLHEDLSTG
ncbi:Exopolyphosphatase 1 [compost metagenome]